MVDTYAIHCSDGRIRRRSQPSIYQSVGTVGTRAVLTVIRSLSILCIPVADPGGYQRSITTDTI